MTSLGDRFEAEEVQAMCLRRKKVAGNERSYVYLKLLGYTNNPEPSGAIPPEVSKHDMFLRPYK